MTYSFNLVKRPWIPCLMMNGENRELSLSEVFAEARKIREIRDTSPLVIAALLRLLLAILHRVFGPASAAEWSALWKGSWDIQKINSYLARYSDRFDLFHPERPFYQVAGIAGAKPSPISRLYHELASGNNATLFDHSLDSSPGRISAAEAARMLVAHQAFAVGGGKSPTGYTTHGPLINGVVVFISGDNLYETLILNLIRYDPEAGEPIPAKNDCPTWELEASISPGTERYVSGYLDLLTWQSRAIHLEPEGPEDSPMVGSLLYAQGVGIADELVKDPQIPLLRDDKRGEYRLRLNPTKALWRDSSALFATTPDKGRPARACEWLARFFNDDLDEAKTYKLSLYGLATDKAKIHLWREESLPLPLKYLEDVDLPKCLAEELLRAEGGARAINQALFVLAKYLVNPRADEPQAHIDLEKVRSLTDEFGAGRDYWSRLELHFYRLVAGLTKDIEKAADEWKHAIREEARAAFERTINGMDSSARTLKAASKAQAALNMGLARMVGKEGGVENAG